MPFKIKLIGEIALSDLLALACLVSINVRSLIVKVPFLYRITLLMLFLLFIQVVSDLYNQTEFINFVRGWAVYIFFFVNLFFLLFCIYNSKERLFLLIIYLMFSKLFFGNGDLDFEIIAQDSNYFKVRFDGFITLFVLLISSYFCKINRYNLAVINLVIFAFWFIFMDARSSGLMLIMCAFLLYIKCFNVQFNWFKILLIFGSALPVLYMLYIYYIELVLHHDFGGYNAQYQVRQMENIYNPFELIYYGRSEIAVLIQAGLDSILFGHGSWAEDPNHKYSIMKQAITGTNSDYKDYIIAHSVILGLFAYSGIFGLVVGIILLLVVMTLSKSLFTTRYIDASAPIYLYFSVNFLWVYLFSPLSALRVSIPIALAVLLSCHYLITVGRTNE
ncbi:hypothetical protein AB4332_13785 [Vibrio breoganii]